MLEIRATAAGKGRHLTQKFLFSFHRKL